MTGIPGLRQMMEWGHESRIRYKLYLLHHLAQVYKVVRETFDVCLSPAYHLSYR